MINKLSMVFAVAFLLQLTTTTACSSELPAKLELVYRASVGGLDIGTLNRHLNRTEAGLYRVNSETNATGIARLLLKDTYAEQSQFRVEGNRVIPIHYRQGPQNNPEKIRTAEFDWDMKKVTLNNGRNYEFKPDMQDAASFLFFWMLRPPEEGKDGVIAIVDGKRMTEYKYQVKGRQMIETLWGETETLLIERHKENEPEKIVRLWLAVKHQYIPVRFDNVRPKYTMKFVLEESSGL